MVVARYNARAVPTDQQTPGLAAILRAAMDARLMTVHTGLPGTVQTYDRAKQQATVQIDVRSWRYEEDSSRTAVIIPPINGVPVIFPGSGKNRITFPVARGDQVWLKFAEASIDRWKQHGGDTDPASDRRHHLTDAVAEIGMHDLAHIPTDSAPRRSGDPRRRGCAGQGRRELGGDPRRAQDRHRPYRRVPHELVRGCRDRGGVL